MNEILAVTRLRNSNNVNYPENYAVLITGFASLIGLNELKKSKEKHRWAYRLFVELMKRHDVVALTGGNPIDLKIEADKYNVFSPWTQGLITPILPTLVGVC
ncbi:hypothetical protein DEO72_LG7g2744 [Vigna unguiculata]|uniref:Uncharacterized protein n=1 Tax=Vigna unguiculata TaxID=3917 RepID=A0A4D6MN74_VIGUN|nr:hypothetical protein DEO72_LG7g2744 [Vigna unguiculata]